MNPKEQAERIVEKYKKAHFKAGGVGMTEKQAKQCAIIALEMLIEANPSKLETYQNEYEDPFGNIMLDETFERVCNKAHYKEVLKEIKNME